MPIRKCIYRIIMVWGALVLVVALLGKVAIASDNGRAAAEFLNIGVGARAAGLGGAYTAVTDDVAAAYWNPGRAVTVKQSQLIVSHFSWYQDINFEYLGVLCPISERLTLSANVSYLSYGAIEGYDKYDTPTGEIGSTYDLAGGISAGYVLSESFAVGVTGKYVMLSLADQSAGALAGDLGLAASINRFTFGAVLSNFGQKFRFNQTEENLPTSLRFGAASTVLGSFLTSVELEHQFYGDLLIKNGLEYNYDRRYFVRAGHCYYPNVDGRGAAGGLTFGAGAILGPARFDYAFSPSEGFSSETIHRLSVIFCL
ncbi:MAG: PorV/PorQ family protein [Candidatus Zixiibacteriota bacterium]|nr:MAG: PorV/PorQ family protein [candidate division Zixibacteria bacterium]